MTWCDVWCSYVTQTRGSLAFSNKRDCWCCMYHAACKVEFQPFKRWYSQLTFFIFFSNMVHSFYKGTGLSLIHISEPTRRYAISYAVFCLKKKWRTSAVSTTVWMVETQLCKLRGTCNTNNPSCSRTPGCQVSGLRTNIKHRITSLDININTSTRTVTC